MSELSRSCPPSAPLLHRVYPLLDCVCLLVAAVFAVFAANRADAGAWLRDEGRGFVATTVYFSEPFDDQSFYTGIYAEYGFSPKLTFGADIGHGVNGTDKSVVFARLPIRLPNRVGGGDAATWRLSAELGLGEISGQAVLRPGLSYGRSIDLAWLNGAGRGRAGDGWAAGGWIGLDGYVELRRDGPTDLKLDATWGATLRNGQLVMIQAQTGRSGDEPAFFRLVPSVTLGLGDRWRAELGLSKSFTGAREHGIKLGIWQDF